MKDHMQQVIDTFAANFDAFVESATDRIVKIEFYKNYSRDQVRQLAVAAIKSFQADLNAGTVQHFAQYWENVGRSRARSGAALEDMLAAVVVAEQVFNQFFRAHYAANLAALAWWLERLHEITFHGAQVLAGIFYRVREEMLQEQALQLRETASPIIPLYKGILVLPLVGTIDEHRAAQIMESLLQGIAREHANVVVMDITGVPMVDTQVANYLIQAARMARLLGAQVVLVGLGPEIAQTIVQLGVDLSDITTRADLQAGIEYVLNLRGLHITPIVQMSAAQPAGTRFN